MYVYVGRAVDRGNVVMAEALRHLRQSTAAAAAAARSLKCRGELVAQIVGRGSSPHPKLVPFLACALESSKWSRFGNNNTGPAPSPWERGNDTNT
jgi:hypothetical protein